ncbi:MAG: homocysteine biosynthesis protein [bacterium]
MGRYKSYEEINDKIKKGDAVVLTASEVSSLSEDMKPSEIVEKVDVVTTGTFSPMCSSGVFLNFGHTEPAMRMEEITLNDVPAYGGVAAVDTFLGATAEKPGCIEYGGAHVIEDLIDGKDVYLKAAGKGTDCYPLKKWEGFINRENINEMIMFNPRNAYQNYASAVNGSKRTIYTYMGVLLPEFTNCTYSTSAEQSPLINDPSCRTTGVGTSIFLGGTKGFISSAGTQFNRGNTKNKAGIPLGPSAAIAVTGNMKNMSSDFIKAAVFEKYGVSLFVGIGIPIPILDEEIAKNVSIKNREIETYISDYADSGKIIRKVNYEELQSGTVEIKGKKVKTAPLSSISKAREISELLKKSITEGNFEITKPVDMFDMSPKQLKKLGENKGGAK